MMGYGLPILVAGIAFAINDSLTKNLVKLPQALYSEGEFILRYKLGLFMVLPEPPIPWD
jgi:hypothetical protein